MKEDFYKSAQSDELKNLSEIFEETEFKYKSITEEKGIWERRLHEIADVLKLENDMQFQRIIEPFWRIGLIWRNVIYG
ncbi:MAG TPA: hypothetical protein VM577_06610 [Anaerovoracaceae bacterium]|nr:hypothetical protein [Anaerovoracaceae bacterium]